MQTQRKKSVGKYASACGSNNECITDASTECRKFKNHHKHVKRSAGLSESLLIVNKIFPSSRIFETETHA